MQPLYTKDQIINRTMELSSKNGTQLKAIARHVEKDDSLKRGLTDSLGRKQEAIFINESGLYALIFGSKLESAKRFKRMCDYGFKESKDFWTKMSKSTGGRPSKDANLSIDMTK